MANTCLVKRDPANKQLLIEMKDDTGAVVASSGRIVLALGDVDGPADTAKREAKFRAFQWKDPDTCILYEAYFLMTEPYTV